MPSVRASAAVPGPEADVLELWADTRRWPAFVESFGSVVRAEGGLVEWQSTRHGPGRVRERTVAPGVVEIETEQLRGTRTARFADGVFEVELDYELKQRTPFTIFFVRRALRDSLRRTLARFAIERRGDVELL
jgi:hypothetical protein